MFKNTELNEAEIGVCESVRKDIARHHATLGGRDAKEGLKSLRGADYVLSVLAGNSLGRIKTCPEELTIYANLAWHKMENAIANQR